MRVRAELPWRNGETGRHRRTRRVPSTEAVAAEFDLLRNESGGGRQVFAIVNEVGRPAPRGWGPVLRCARMKPVTIILRAVTVPACVLALLLTTAPAASAVGQYAWQSGRVLYDVWLDTTGANSGSWLASRDETVTIVCDDSQWGNDRYLIRDDVRGDGWVPDNAVIAYYGPRSVWGCFIWDAPRRR